MNKSAKRSEGRKGLGAGQLWLRLPGLVGEALYETVIGVGLACVAEALEAERMTLCGARYAHMAGRQALRGGHVASSLVLGGRRIAVSRRRGVDRTNRIVPLLGVLYGSAFPGWLAVPFQLLGRVDEA